MNDLRIVINLAEQRLTLVENGAVRVEYAVSTSVNGAGEREGSECTPRGHHVISEKFGADAPANTVFVARKPTGEIWTPELGAANPARDWILTRILWLEGREERHNRGGDVDTKRRYIYIHGAPDSVPMGVPRSHGCIRMRNADVIELFDRVPAGTPVDIIEEAT
jgi:L,D-transpeptidase YbiS